MASDVQVRIEDGLIISALNTPGGGVYEWRDETANEIERLAQAAAPINDPLNELHRAPRRGLYKASFSWTRVGSNGHRVRAHIVNSAPHADIVEFGRSGVVGYQRFSWTVWEGETKVVRFTSGRPGQHILRDAARYVLPGHI